MKKFALTLIVTLLSASIAWGAKTTFVDGNKATGTKGTVVTADFLNRVNNHRHDGAASDGSSVLDYYLAGGTANNLTISPNPALTAHVTGMPIYVRAAYAPTGAATISVNYMPTVPLKRADGSALQGGEYSAGSIITIAYDGSGNYRLISPTPAASNNQPNTAVARDASGNFSAGVITGTLNGSASALEGKSWVPVAEASWTGAIAANSEVEVASLLPPAAAHRFYRVSIYSPILSTISYSSGGTPVGGVGYKITRWVADYDKLVLTNSTNASSGSTTWYYKVDVWE